MGRPQENLMKGELKALTSKKKGLPHFARNLMKGELKVLDLAAQVFKPSEAESHEGRIESRLPARPPRLLPLRLNLMKGELKGEQELAQVRYKFYLVKLKKVIQ